MQEIKAFYRLFRRVQRIAIARTLAMDPEIILLDEPTSALDPTMVGEVQAVIRELAKSGKTMMIVTHEMEFARAICNRVFYMDEGGVYEDGPPAQVFDAPQREKTRRFVQRLKVLELHIESRDYDFLGMAGEIAQYCGKNQLSQKLSNRVQLAFEELVQQMLLGALEQPRIDVIVEHAQAEERTTLTVRYNGPQMDVTESADELSLMVLRGMVTDMSYSATGDGDCANQLVLELKA